MQITSLVSTKIRTQEATSIKLKICIKQAGRYQQCRVFWFAQMIDVQQIKLTFVFVLIRHFVTLMTYEMQ